MSNHHATKKFTFVVYFINCDNGGESFFTIIASDISDARAKAERQIKHNGANFIITNIEQE